MDLKNVEEMNVPSLTLYAGETCTIGKVKKLPRRSFG